MTVAADVLGVPQSTLSRALSRVEHELGVRVFERRQTGLEPTSLGELVLAAADDIDARYRRLEADIANEVDPDTGVVRLAFLGSMGASYVPELLRRFRQEAPGVRVLLTQAYADEITEGLLDRRIDIALTTDRPRDDAGWSPLRTERLVVVVSPDHRFAGRRRVSPAEVVREPFIASSAQVRPDSQTSVLFAAAGVAPSVTIESQDAATIEGLVSVGLGVAVVPDTTVRSPDVVRVELDSPHAVRSIGMTWRTDVPLPQPAERLRSMVEREFAVDGSRP